MNRGLYIGSTSLVTNQRKLEVLSNNLANINTTGYKKDFSVTESFPEKLMAKKSKLGERQRPISEDNITYENLGNNVHRARTEEGFFKVETNRGTSHVKEIKWTQDEDGYLRTNYKNLNDDIRTDNENYILDRSGNRVQNLEDIEESLSDMVYRPQAHVIGTLSRGVNFKRTHIDFTQGGIVDTGSDFDIALNGQGFLKVQGEEGETLYTRNGNLTTVQQGETRYLSDLNGNLILGQNGPIEINGNKMEINIDGRVSIDGQVVGQLDVVDIENKEFLRKAGGNNLRMALVNGEPIPAEEIDFEGNIYQGNLESSNMNAIDGMTEMISLMRDFEANQKVVRMQDEMLEKAATELGRV